MPRSSKLIFLLLLACGSEENRPKLKVERSGADSVVVISTSADRKNWIMKAKEVEERGDTLVGFGIRVVFYSGNSPSSSLKADSGKYDRVSGDMSALGRVHFRSDSAEVWTKALFWSQKDRKIWTDQPVKVKQGDVLVEAVGMETDPQVSYIEFKSSVRGTGSRLPEEF